MYKQLLIICIIYFSGLIASEAKIDTTKSLANEKDRLAKKVKSLIESSTFDELFEKAIQSRIYKLLNPESFSLIVELNPNRVDDFGEFVVGDDILVINSYGELLWKCRKKRNLLKKVIRPLVQCANPAFPIIVRPIRISCP